MVPLVIPVRYGHEPHTVFHEPSRKKRTLPERRLSITLPDGFWLVLDRECFFGAWRANQVVRGLIERVHGFEDSARVVAAEFAIHNRKKRVAALHAGPVYAQRQLDITH